MEEVIKLPQTVEKPKIKKRVRVPAYNPKQELMKRRRNVKNLTVLGENDASVKLLEDLVFGAEDELVERLIEDKQGASLLDDDDEDEDDLDDPEVESEAHLKVPSAKKAAWVDDDDERMEEVDMSHRFRKYLTKGEAESKMTKQKLQQRMTEQFQKSMGGKPTWAEVKVKKSKKKGDDSEEDEDEDDDDDLLRKTGNFVAASETLPSGTLRVKKCLHANSARPCSDQLTTVQFHPSAQVVMTAGLDQSISLFQVDGRTNPKIQSIHLERFPIHKAQFSRDGESVVATGVKNKMFYMYDMMEGRVVPVFSVRGLKQASVREFSVSPEGDSLLLSGNDGYLHVLKLKTKEVVQSLKINGSVSGVAFSPDGSNVFAQSEEGEVYVWDMRSSRCVNKFADDGCVKGTSIATSRNGQYLACGSQSGVVNVYSQQDCLTSANPRPLKTLMNLVTPVTSLAFNPASEILAMASQNEDEALRLVHLPSLTVFSNFPITTKKKYIHRTSCLDFSPHSGFFSLANNKGDALLTRLLHYKDF
ncbi:U3 small nucleolar RNA-associated protein 18 homolog [Gadus chalcogrammus]|uniref:U3 small nucleolar RNA-associated protein 18 homolog n=1 Tax=Gadus chalcogrammus TaxID=1042646 RepID=UPI0024C2C931|nr:U3 small nucleolar RNA-associated protein 18 homolog [Gadus chalcogrammus]